jgi:DNA adenine methylase
MELQKVELSNSYSLGRQTYKIISNKGRYIKSPLNYIGGKFKLLDQIIDMFPNQYTSFVDLFAGGMNVSANVEAKKIYVNDNLTFLVEMYESFNNNSVEYILNHIENAIFKYQLTKENEEGFKNFRSYYNKTKNPLDLFVLIAFSFNHQIRFNNSHEYNNPFGRNRSSYNKNMQSNLIRFINKLHSTDYYFSSLSFEDFKINSLDENSFVYCDPPYLITTGSYNDGKRGFKGWGEEQEVSLLNKLDKINSLGIKFALSNVLEHKGRSNFTLENWINSKGYYVNFVNSDYSNSNYQSSKNANKNSLEVLVTNYDVNKERKIASLFN